jgi:hypothetical protein
MGKHESGDASAIERILRQAFSSGVLMGHETKKPEV